MLFSDIMKTLVALLKQKQKNLDKKYLGFKLDFVEMLLHFPGFFLGIA